MISIRPAVSNDSQTLQKLFEQLGYQTQCENIRRRLSEKTAYEIILVASTDEEICGVVVLNFITPMHEDGCWGVISALAVDEIKRGAGIGHRLLAEAEAAAKANGCSKIELASSMKRERAHKFYESHGYEEKRKRYIKLLISP